MYIVRFILNVFMMINSNISSKVGENQNTSKLLFVKGFFFQYLLHDKPFNFLQCVWH